MSGKRMPVRPEPLCARLVWGGWLELDGEEHTQTMPKARPFFSTNQSDRKRMDGV